MLAYRHQPDGRMEPYAGLGSLVGTLVGALLIGVLSNGMTLMNIESFHQQIIMGFVILLAVLVDRRRRVRSRARGRI